MGSIPFGFILTKIFLKKDIREIGSGNIGATNTLRAGNKLVGYSTLILDIVKAIIPVIYVKMNYPELIYIASLWKVGINGLPLLEIKWSRWWDLTAVGKSPIREQKIYPGIWNLLQDIVLSKRKTSMRRKRLPDQIPLTAALEFMK